MAELHSTNENASIAKNKINNISDIQHNFVRPFTQTCMLILYLHQWQTLAIISEHDSNCVLTVYLNMYSNCTHKARLDLTIVHGLTNIRKGWESTGMVNESRCKK